MSMQKPSDMSKSEDNNGVNVKISKNKGIE